MKAHLGCDFCYFLCGAFKIVLQKGLFVDFEKSPGVACLVSRAEKQQRFLLSCPILGSQKVYATIGQQNELQALSASNDASGISDDPFYVGMLLKMKTSLGKEGARQDTEQASKVGLTPLKWFAIDELRLLAIAKEKSRADRFAYSDN